MYWYLETKQDSFNTYLNVITCENTHFTSL
jgi:hypothetical protein